MIHGCKGWGAARRETPPIPDTHAIHSTANAWQAGTVVDSFMYTLPAPGTVPGEQQALNKSLLEE